jgi:tetratricopeptide (TPR) repeat protein
MKKNRKALIHTFLWVLGFSLLVLTGCVSNVRKPEASLDTPEHHVFSGMKLFEAGDLKAAEKELHLALELDPDYCRGLYGLGLVQGHQNDFKTGFASMKQAKSIAADKREKSLVHTGFMRLYLLEKGELWLDRVQEHYSRAVIYDKDFADPRFYMGLAYKETKDFEKAGREFEKVLTIKDTLIEEADRELKMVQKVLRALPGTEIGKALVRQEAITRADAAAIFVHELEVDKIFKRHGIKGNKLKAYPKDIKDHTLKTDIVSVLDIGLKGIQPYPDWEFKPNALITRAGYAMMIGDIIATLSRDNSLRTKFIGQVSAFPDVEPDLPYFNAIMLCTTRGIMEPKDFMTGAFDPAGTVSGAEALIIIRKLKEKLTLH